MITLSDINDNAPQFVSTTPKTIVLTEKNEAGMQVAVLTATDPDDPETGNGQVQYFIVGGNASTSSQNSQLKRMRRNLHLRTFVYVENLTDSTFSLVPLGS